MRYRQPTTTTIDLEFVRKSTFKWGFFHYTEKLPLNAIGPVLQYANINNTLRYDSSRNKNLFTACIYTETDSSEYKFLYTYIS